MPDSFLAPSRCLTPTKQERSTRKEYANLDTSLVGICESCGEGIGGSGVKMRSGRMYCTNHFCCEKCDIAIPIGSSFITRRTFPYCKSCANHKQLSCHMCALFIGGDVVHAMGHAWHPEHFLCECCHIPLTKQFGEEAYFVHNDKPYCEKDYNQMIKNKGIPSIVTHAPSPTSSPESSAPNSPFAGRKVRSNKQRKNLHIPTGKSFSPPLTTPFSPRHLTKIQTASNSFLKSDNGQLVLPERSLLEQEKRGSFLMQKETREEYVRIRSSLNEISSTSMVSPPVERPNLPFKNSIEALRTFSGEFTRDEQKESAIGKKLLDASVLVSDICEVLDFNEVVGKGGFATVRQAVLKESKESVAVKIFNKWELKEDAIVFIKREVGTLAHLRHPNVRQFRNIYEDDHYLYVTMEFVKGESLYDHVEKVDHLSETNTKEVIFALLKIVEYLHKERYIHQDIKTENILLPQIDSPFTNMKLIDFGFCRFLAEGELLREYCGSYHYMAPEMIMRQDYGLPVDLWSVGVTLYILLAGLRPFFSQEEASVANIQWFDEDWENYSPNAKKLVIQLLNPNQNERVTATQALMHPWFHE